MDIYKNEAIIRTDEDKARIGVEKNENGQLLTDSYTSIDSNGKRIKFEFYGNLNINAVAKKLIEIADRDIVCDKS